jgi:hypothetical protein
MGKMNLLTASWDGKVGETVGAKWKSEHTIRTYAKPTYKRTPAQDTVRTGFGEITKFVALFAPDLTGLTSLNLRNMSIRNAIIKANAKQVTAGALDPTTLEINTGGLPIVSNLTNGTVGTTTLAVTWLPGAFQNITAKAKVIAVWINQAKTFSAVGSALYSAGTLNLTLPAASAAADHLYAYVLDYRGSAKVGSKSVYHALA